MVLVVSAVMLGAKGVQRVQGGGDKARREVDKERLHVIDGMTVEDALGLKLPFDGGGEGEDSVVLEHLTAEQMEENVRSGLYRLVDDQPTTQQSSATLPHKPHLAMGDRLTMFSVCAGIGSGQMAVKHAGLAVDTIGICEIDEERIAIF
jgi:hypothetical protein